MAGKMSESTQVQRLSSEGSLVLLKFVLKCLFLLRGRHKAAREPCLPEPFAVWLCYWGGGGAERGPHNTSRVCE